MIRVAIAVPEPYRQRAAYVFGVFSQQWGIPVALVADGDASADVRYRAQPDPPRGAAIDIPFDARAYVPAERCTTIERNGYQLWTRPNTDPAAVDVVGGSYRLLTFLDEQQVDEAARDRRGIFQTAALPSPRSAVGKLPVVDHHAGFSLRSTTATSSPLRHRPAAQVAGRQALRRGSDP